MRTVQSSIYFPRAFLAYFTLFHIYYFSCPFGFTYAALLSSSLFLLHSMFFFMNRFELPAFVSGQVNYSTPRMAIFRNVSIHPLQTATANGRSSHPSVTYLESYSNHQSSLSRNSTSHLSTPEGGLPRSNSRHIMANGMTYPSMSSLGRITTTFNDLDE